MDNDIKELLEKRDAQQLKNPRLKSRLLSPHLGRIKEMLALDISLPLILSLLKEKKKIQITLQTLRNYVVREFGEEHYEEYCKRNGWLRSKRADKGKSSNASENAGNSELGFTLDIPKPKTFKRTTR